MGVRSVFRFFIFSNLFIALCCVVMCLLTYHLFNIPFSIPYLLFAFFGTITSYSFHWYFSTTTENSTGRELWTHRNRNIHLILLIIGLAGSIYSFIDLLPHWKWLLSAVFVTFIYSAPKLPFRLFQSLKKVAVGKTSLLAFAWMHITVSLPLMLSEDPWTSGHYVFSINRFFYLFSICILFDYRDRDSDFEAGIRSMVTQLNEKGVNVLFWCTQLLVFAGSFLLLPYFDNISVLLLLLPSVVLSFYYEKMKRSRSDITYYFVLDGFMMLSALMIFLFFILTKFEG